ncbi:hypothetical protein D9615_005679 [Tricholomella constricta]|uniref:Uncharacterized protein n=1 Tax=Tricholomella constricta TaxID=117010 RepID=A0A8H5M3S0_9AGAR|nr:hypothetical protein D9615_005679 [Tricholomella constricta]
MKYDWASWPLYSGMLLPAYYVACVAPPQNFLKPPRASFRRLFCCSRKLRLCRLLLPCLLKRASLHSMIAFRALAVLAAVAGALANPLQARQALLPNPNSNVDIHNVVSELDMQVHINIPNILRLQASHTATDSTIGAEVDQLVTAFENAQSALSDIRVSKGSTTRFPTNDEISVVYGDIMQLVATGVSGLTPAVVPSITSIIARLDQPVSAASTQLNTTLPNSIYYVHTLMLDAQQFLVKEGTWPLTLAALGF